MSERKSSRARKAVKYAGFEDESDDDFADTKPCKSKKMKTKEDEDKKKPKERLTESHKGGILPSDEPSSIRKRKSLTVKLYERELEEALQLSLLETSTSESLMSNPELSSSSNPSSSANMQVEVEVIHSKAPELTKVDDEVMQSEVKTYDKFDKEPPPLLPLDPSKIGTVMDDSIECVTDKEEETKKGRRRQRKAAQKPVIIDDDDNSGGTVMDNSIERITDKEEENKNSRRRQRKAAQKPVIIDDDDNFGGESDFNPVDNSDSDSNEDDEDEGDEEFSPDEDSDFDDHHKKKGKENRKNDQITKKSNPPPKNNKPNKGTAQKNLEKVTQIQDTKNAVANRKPLASTTVKKHSHPSNKAKEVLSPLSSTTTATTSIPAVSFKSKASTSSTPVTSIQRSTERLSQSWKAPGPANKDNNASPMVRSPSSGLRLGLSRNQRVKSLHSGVRVV